MAKLAAYWGLWSKRDSVYNRESHQTWSGATDWYRALGLRATLAYLWKRARHTGAGWLPKTRSETNQKQKCELLLEFIILSNTFNRAWPTCFNTFHFAVMVKIVWQCHNGNKFVERDSRGEKIYKQYIKVGLKWPKMENFDVKVTSEIFCPASTPRQKQDLSS